MRNLLPLNWLLVPAVLLIGCTSPSRVGLPPDSPFAEPVVLAPDVLPQGIAIGDLTATSAVLWVRTNGPEMVQVEWAPPSVWEMLSQSAKATVCVARTVRVTTSAEADFTASIPLQGMLPATRYRYHVLVGHGGDPASFIETKTAASGEFTTAPDPGTAAPVTFAWSGDLGGQQRCRQGPGGYPIFDVIRRQHPDFFLFLGDTIYADNPCASPPNEPGADFIAATLPEYRDRHRYQRGAESLRRFLETVPVYVTWDDHEVRNDFSGPFDERMPAGRQALREYWPIFPQTDDPHRLYRAVRHGSDLELFILDTRQYRSRDGDPDGPAKTMLGPAQLHWLLEGLARSSARWKLVATSVPLSIPKGGAGHNDGWSGGPNGPGFEHERQVIVDAIVRQRIKNVVFIAGDVHYVQANAYDPDGDGLVDFHEFVAGPLSAIPGRLTPAGESLHPTRLTNQGGYYNFGLVRIAGASLEVVVVDDAGTTRFSHHLSAR
jgi:alkaline phosphatase D